jgi:hypothetical protein
MKGLVQPVWPPASEGLAAPLAAAAPYVAGAVLLHAGLLAVALAWPQRPLPAGVQAASSPAAAPARRAAGGGDGDGDGARLREGVRRLEQIQRSMAAAADPGASAPAAGAASAPADLLARAQALAAAIDAADRRLRARELARLTGMPQAEAERTLAAEAAAARPAPGPASTAAAVPAASPAEEVAQLAQRAQAVAEQARARRDAAAQGTRIAPAASAAPASATGRGLPPPLPPMSRWRPWGERGGGADQGPPGAAPSRFANAARAASGARGSDGPRPVAASAAGAAGPAAQAGRSHDLVAYLRPPPPAVAAGVAKGAGRSFGPGGLHADRVYLDSWYVVGPFPGRGDRSMFTAYAPEQQLDLAARYAGLDGRVLRWTYTSRGFYPFVLPEPANDAVYFAYTEIRVDQDLDVVLTLAADDEARLWIDGRLVWASAPDDKPWLHPPYYVPHERSASLALMEAQRRVRLERGVHRLLVKLYNRSQHAFFSVVVSP